MTYKELADRIHAIEMTVEKAHEDLSALLVAVEKMEEDENAAPAEEAPAPAAKPKPKKTEAKPLTLEEVRAKLTSLAGTAGGGAVKKLLKDFGAEKLSDIAAQDYPELLAKAEEMGQ